MNLRLTPQAGAQLQSLFNYISAESPAAAQTIRDRIGRAFVLILEYPGAGQVSRIRGLRRLAVPRTPYVILYRISQDIEILAILHGRQNRRA